MRRTSSISQPWERLGRSVLNLLNAVRPFGKDGFHLCCIWIPAHLLRLTNKNGTALGGSWQAGTLAVQCAGTACSMTPSQWSAGSTKVYLITLGLFLIQPENHEYKSMQWGPPATAALLLAWTLCCGHQGSFSMHLSLHWGHRFTVVAWWGWIPDWMLYWM